MHIVYALHAYAQYTMCMIFMYNIIISYELHTACKVSQPNRRHMTNTK